MSVCFLSIPFLSHSNFSLPRIFLLDFIRCYHIDVYWTELTPYAYIKLYYPRSFNCIRPHFMSSLHLFSSHHRWHQHFILNALLLLQSMFWLRKSVFRNSRSYGTRRLLANYYLNAILRSRQPCVVNVQSPWIEKLIHKNVVKRYGRWGRKKKRKRKRRRWLCAHTSARLFGCAESHLAYQHLPPYDIQ